MDKKTIPELRESINQLMADWHNLGDTPNIAEMRALIKDINGLLDDAEIVKRNLTDRIECRHKSARAEHKALLDIIRDLLLHKIPSERNQISGELKKRQRGHEEKYSALRSAGLSPEQISTVLPPLSEAEKAEFEARIAALDDEARVLSDFNKTHPDYDLSLLANTRLRQYAEPPEELPEAA